MNWQGAASWREEYNAEQARQFEEKYPDSVWPSGDKLSADDLWVAAEIIVKEIKAASFSESGICAEAHDWALYVERVEIVDGENIANVIECVLDDWPARERAMLI